MNYLSDSVIETQRIAESLAKKVKIGTVLSLMGDLGTGKTTFTQGFAKGLGIDERVGSPTFKLVSEYNGIPHRLYHIDAYRLNGVDDFLNIGGEEFLISSDGVTLIEWADIISEVLPKDTIKIKFSRLPGKPETRYIEIDGLNNNG